MATIDIGKLTFTHKGDYAGGTAYVLNDVVYYNGSAYIAKQATTNNVPTNATYWNLFVLKGTDTSVLTTQGDVLYHTGSALARLPAGTSGQFLKTQGSGANPVWGNVTSAILQMKSVSTGVQFSTNTAGWTGTSAPEYTPVTLTITPTSATSLLKVDYCFTCVHQSDYMGIYWLTYNHSGISETAVENDDSYGATRTFDYGNNNTSDMGSGISGTVYLDPQTTNAVTVKHRFGTSNASWETMINRTIAGNGNNDSAAGVCTVTISEIASGIITHTKGANINGD